MRLPTPLLDLAFTMLFLFMLYTIMLLASFGEAPERTLPPIDLPQASEGSSPGFSRVEPATISLKQERGETRFYLNDKPLSGPELETHLRDLSPREVILRAGSDVRYGDIVPLLAMVNALGVREVSMAYATKK